MYEEIYAELSLIANTNHFVTFFYSITCRLLIIFNLFLEILYHPTAVLPFLLYTKTQHHNIGFRNCIGQHFALNEEKVVIAKLLRRYEFKSVYLFLPI